MPTRHQAHRRTMKAVSGFAGVVSIRLVVGLRRLGRAQRLRRHHQHQSARAAGGTDAGAEQCRRR